MKKINFWGYFLFSQFLLYCTFLYLDFNQIYDYHISSWIKLTSIFICCIYAFSQRKKSEQPALALLIYALFFTFLADIFLLFTTFHEIGVLFFCLVQILYRTYLRKTKATLVRVTLLLFGCLLSAFMLYLYMPDFRTHTAPSLFSLCLFYILMLISNIAISHRNKEYRLFSWGLILLFLCDIQVGMFNILDPNHALYHIVAVGMWLFYLPSQILIVLYIHSNIQTKKKSL